jgi:cytochrome c-type biogenesis protein CcmE
MKKSHIFGIIVIAIAVTIIISTAGDASSYVSFSEAKELSERGKKSKIHVVGQLKKSSTGEIIGIEESPDKLSFSFIMVDDNNREEKVFYNEPVPTDFQRSEQVVVVGSFRNETFIADKILMKCPSKYQENEIK